MLNLIFKRYKNWVVVLVIIAATYFGIDYIKKEHKKNLKQLEEEKKDVENKLKSIKALNEKEKIVKSYLDNFIGKDSQSFMRLISKIARQDKIDVISLKPAYGESVAPSGSSRRGKDKGTSFESITLSLKSSCEYEALVSFLQSIDKQQLMVRVERMNVRRFDNTGDDLSVDLDISGLKIDEAVLDL